MPANKTRTRLLRLEHAIHNEPCPQCGHTTMLHTGTATGNAANNAANKHARENDCDFDDTRLTTAERNELAALIRTCSPQCTTCGYPTPDIDLLTDEQKTHALELLRRCEDR